MNLEENKSSDAVGQINHTEIAETELQNSAVTEPTGKNSKPRPEVQEKDDKAGKPVGNAVSIAVQQPESSGADNAVQPVADEVKGKANTSSGKPKTILIGLILFFTAVLIFAVAELIHMYIGYASARQQYAEINETYVDIVPDIVFAPPDSSAPVYSELSPVSVDFDGLKASCPDIQGWLYSEGTIISYPIVQCDDNETYLHNAMDGSYSYGGTLFVDCICQAEFLGKNTIVYGHNMNDGSMFASLISYRDQSYYDEHPIMYLNTPVQNYKVVIFAGYTTPADSDTYTYSFADDATFEAYVEKMAEQSDFDSGVLPGTNDRIITLSTCAYDYDEARYVIQGVLEPIG